MCWKVIQMPNSNQRDIQVLFWGMSVQFSTLVFEGLLKAGINFCGLVVPATDTTRDTPPIIRLDPDPPRSQLPMSRPYLQRGITQIAWQNQIPVIELRRMSSPDATDQLAALEADLTIVACFPRLIPQQILALSPRGFLN